MKLLTTGGAGFIGANFIRYWLKSHPQDKIVNLDNLTYAGNLSTTKDFSSNNNYSFVKGNGSEITRNDLPIEINDTRLFMNVKSMSRKLNVARVESAIKKTGGNKAKAARLLDVGRATLYRFLNEHPDLQESFCT